MGEELFFLKLADKINEDAFSGFTDVIELVVQNLYTSSIMNPQILPIGLIYFL